MPVCAMIGAPPITLTLVDQKYDNTNTGSFSFPAVNFGTPASDRLIIGCISYRRNTALGLSGVTIGGISATVVSGTATSTDDAFIFYALVPTGTSGTIAMSALNSVGCSLVVYTLTGQLSNTPVSQQYITSGSPLSATITVPDKTVVIANAVTALGGNSWGGSAGIVPQTFRSPAANTSDIDHGTAALTSASNLGSVTVTHVAAGASKMNVVIWT